MKTIIFTLLVCFFTCLSFAQNITWETDYHKATELIKKGNSVLLLYFFDGSNSSLERTIKNEILKSEALKSTQQNIVILEIDKSSRTEENPYFNRLLSAYNSENVFPAIRATKPSTAKNTDLFTIFDSLSKTSFIKQIKNL